MRLRRFRAAPPERPRLKRLGNGEWASLDGTWTFLRHHSDPHPQRWFAFQGDDEYPSNEGSGHTRLADVANWALGEARDGL